MTKTSIESLIDLTSLKKIQTQVYIYGHVSYWGTWQLLNKITTSTFAHNHTLNKYIESTQTYLNLISMHFAVILPKTI